MGKKLLKREKSFDLVIIRSAILIFVTILTELYLYFVKRGYSTQWYISKMPRMMFWLCIALGIACLLSIAAFIFLRFYKKYNERKNLITSGSVALYFIFITILSVIIYFRKNNDFTIDYLYLFVLGYTMLYLILRFYKSDFFLFSFLDFLGILSFVILRTYYTRFTFATAVKDTVGTSIIFLIIGLVILAFLLFSFIYNKKIVIKKYVIYSPLKKIELLPSVALAGLYCLLLLISFYYKGLIATISIFLLLGLFLAFLTRKTIKMFSK